MTVNVTNRTIVRTIVWVIATIVIFKVMGRISHGLTLVFISFFFALALNPAVEGISRRLKVESRVRATLATFAVALVILTAFFVLITPPLVRQTRTFIITVPDTIQNFQNQDSRLAQAARKYHLDEKISQGARDFANHYSDFGSTVLDTGKRIAETVASIVAVLVMTFMMLVEGPKWLELFWGVMPTRNRQHQKMLARRIYRGISGFVNGQVILAVLAGIFAFIALEIASHIEGVSVNAQALAGIVALFGLIPLFGNPIAASLVVLVCLINSVTLGLIMLVYFILYFFIENHTFQPYIQSRLNELSPLVVFIAAILGVGFAGFLGAIIAIPTATAIKILVEDYFETQRHKKAPTEDLNTP